MMNWRFITGISIMSGLFLLFVGIAADWKFAAISLGSLWVAAFAAYLIISGLESGENNG